MIEVFVDKKELEKALARLNELEERGLGASLVSFKLKSTGEICSEDIIEFNDQFIIRAEPNNPKKDWGRISGDMIEWYKYEDGVLKDC